ncbi:MAG: hypothetical protein R3E48_08180 [Burkholderiaceae bacterium]
MTSHSTDLWRAHQAAQSRKFRDIEIAQQVLDLAPDRLRVACVDAGIAVAERDTAELRGLLTARLREIASGG